MHGTRNHYIEICEKANIAWELSPRANRAKDPDIAGAVSSC